MMRIFYDSMKDRLVIVMAEVIRREEIVVKTEASSTFSIDREIFLQALWEISSENPDFAKFVGCHPENYLKLNVKLDFTTSSLPDEDPEETPDDSVMQLWSGD